MKVEIKNRYTQAVLYAADISDEIDSGLALRHALEKAVSVGANLDGANLRGANLGGANLDGANLGGANLRGAYLRGANLRGAYLRGANLDGANLGGANLRGANLRGAYLGGANLRGANLRGANLGGANLDGKRPVIQIGPLGSRSDYLVGYITDKGLFVRTGCFFGTIEEFADAVVETHGSNEFAREYLAAIELLKLHASIYPANPVTEVKK